jgi:hypothetical protein
MTSEPDGPDDVVIVRDEAHGLTLRVPTRTADGEPVALDRDERDGAHRLHAHAPDGSTVYVEVVSFPGLVDHDVAIAEQQATLRMRAPGAAIGPIRPATVAGRPATAFEFAGAIDGVRRRRWFAFVDTASRTVRIVTDPGSPADDAILATLVLDDDRP